VGRSPLRRCRTGGAQRFHAPGEHTWSPNALKRDRPSTACCCSSSSGSTIPSRTRWALLTHRFSNPWGLSTLSTAAHDQASVAHTAASLAISAGAEPESGAADARARLGGDDAGRVRRTAVLRRCRPMRETMTADALMSLRTAAWQAATVSSRACGTDRCPSTPSTVGWPMTTSSRRPWCAPSPASRPRPPRRRRPPRGRRGRGERVRDPLRITRSREVPIVKTQVHWSPSLVITPRIALQQSE
jgi:hypothetical protein